MTAAFFATGLAGVAFLTLTAAFFGAGFFAAAFFTATFFTAAFFTTTFFAAGLGAGLAFFGFALATPLRATGLATGFLATGLAATRVLFAGVLLAFFTIRPLLAAVFDLAALASDALVAVLSLCALAAVELALVFAISLHRDWPWRPGVIADVFYTSKPASGILVPLHASGRFGNVNILSRLILWLLRWYKRWISPLLGPRCRFQPSCSDYARIAVIRFGPWRGGLLAGWRLLRCQPLCTGGEDPVPEHFHYPRCRGHRDCTDGH